MLKNEIWVFCRENLSRVQKISLNLLHKAFSLINNSDMCLCAVIISEKTQPTEMLLNDLQNAGVEKLYWLTNNRQTGFQFAVHAIFDIIKRVMPGIVLFDVYDDAKQCSASLAYFCNTGLCADCVNLYIDQKTGEFIQVREVNNYEIVCIATPNSKPAMATVLYDEQYFLLPVINSKLLQVYITTFENDNNFYMMSCLSQTKELYTSLNSYNTILVGGLGLKTKENFQLLYELGKLSGAGIGATRSAVEMRWAHEENLVGMSGSIVSPKLCIAFGVSGSSQHMIGIKSSTVLIAVNINNQAPILKYAHYHAVCDAGTLLQKLISLIKTNGRYNL